MFRIMMFRIKNFFAGISIRLIWGLIVTVVIVGGLAILFSGWFNQRQVFGNWVSWVYNNVATQEQKMVNGEYWDPENSTVHFLFFDITDQGVYFRGQAPERSDYENIEDFIPQTSETQSSDPVESEQSEVQTEETTVEQTE